jgi:hypothetical protein
MPITTGTKKMKETRIKKKLAQEKEESNSIKHCKKHDRWYGVDCAGCREKS